MEQACGIRDDGLHVDERAGERTGGHGSIAELRCQCCQRRRRIAADMNLCNPDMEIVVPRGDHERSVAGRTGGIQGAVDRSAGGVHRFESIVASGGDHDLSGLHGGLKRGGERDRTGCCRAIRRRARIQWTTERRTAKRQRQHVHAIVYGIVHGLNDGVVGGESRGPEYFVVSEECVRRHAGDGRSGSGVGVAGGSARGGRAMSHAIARGVVPDANWQPG